MVAMGFLFVGPGTKAAFSQDTIKIGVFGPMSGGAAYQGQSEREGVEVVASEVNAAGGIFGKKIELIIGDDAGKPDEAVNVVNRFITKDNVLMVIGSISSPCSFAASEVTRRYQIPHIIVAGTAARITLQGNEWLFRSASPDTKLCGDFVEFINEKYPKIKKFSFLYVNDDFGKGGYDAFVKAGSKHGYQIAIAEKYTRGDLDFTAQLTRIKMSGAQALVEWSRYSEAILIKRQMRSMGIELPHFGSDGHSIPKYLELAGEAANGVYYPTHWSPATSAHIKTSQDFMKKIKNAFNKEPDAMTAEAYDAANIAVQAIKDAGSLDRAKIRDAIRAIKYKSVRGDMRFDKNGDPILETHVVKVVNGKEANGRTEPVLK